KPGPAVANQVVRGVSGGPLSSGMTAEQHYAKAKDEVRARAKLMCETIVTNGGYRNAKWTVADSPCDCQRPNNVVMNCIADLAYSCRWEMKVAERTENFGERRACGALLAIPVSKYRNYGISMPCARASPDTTCRKDTRNPNVSAERPRRCDFHIFAAVLP